MSGWRLGRLVTAAATLALPWSAAAQDARAFLTPPYDAMTHGTGPALEKGNTKLPRLRAGDVAGFFLTREGDIRTAACNSAVNRAVVQPTANVVIPIAREDGRLTVSVESVTMRAAGATGGIAPLTSQVTVGTVVASGNLAAREHTERVAEATARAGLAPRTETRVAATERGGSGQHTERSRVEVTQERGTQEMKPRTVGVGTRAAVGRGSLLSLFDSDFLAALSETEYLMGFLDEDGNLVVLEDNEYVGVLNEWEGTVALYDEDAEVSRYLDGLLTARFRREWPALPADARYETAVSCDVVPLIVYHGSHVGLVYTIRNAGTAPVFDFLLLSGVPTHSTYVAAAERGVGFAVSYIDRQRAFLIRLFRPLKPGETFRTVVVARMNPWIVREDAESPDATSAGRFGR